MTAHTACGPVHDQTRIGKCGMMDEIDPKEMGSCVRKTREIISGRLMWVYVRMDVRLRLKLHLRVGRIQ
jgi:hypothetical protein